MGARGGALAIPPGGTTPFPLLVILHGASGDADGMLATMSRPIAEWKPLVMAPESRSYTWDGLFGKTADLRSLDDTLQKITERFPLDPMRLAIGGFSDGASFALTVGLANPELFTAVLAFSPGFFIAPEAPAACGTRMFVSHGRRDPVLPFDSTGFAVVEQLRSLGIETAFHPFDGGHEMPAAAVAAAIAFWLDRSGE